MTFRMERIHVIQIDEISINNYQVWKIRLIRHLDQLGVQKLDFILGTHVHSDHIGEQMKFNNRYQIDKFYLKNIRRSTNYKHLGIVG